MWSESDGEMHEESIGRSSAGSEVVMIDDRMISAASRTARTPNISNLNVTKSSRVHVGPKFVSVTQNVHNSEVVKELPFPQYIWSLAKNSTKAERLSCGVAVIGLIACIILILVFTLFNSTGPEEIIDIAPHDWNITREMWLAKNATYNETLNDFKPLRLVIVQHTVSSQCHRFKTCAAELRNMQAWFFKEYDYDIPYNFLIGNDGRVYEGRGWSIIGAHTYSYNRCSIGIGFFGDYREEMDGHAVVSELQINRTKMLLEEALGLGNLHPDYYLVGAKDLKSTESPGSNLYNAIRQFPHYDNASHYRGMSCDQIHALYNIKL